MQNLSDSKIKKVTILGGGSFSTAIAVLLKHNCEKTFMWEYNQDIAKSMQESRLNHHLNVRIPENVFVTSDLSLSIDDSELIFIAVPSSAVEEVITKAKPYIKKNQQIIICSKGLTSTQEFLSDCVHRILPENNFFVLAGPALAPEIVIPGDQTLTVMDLAGSIGCQELKEKIQSKNLFVNITDDIKGVQLGSFKNVLTIFSGMLEGAKFPQNTQSAILIMGIRDILKIGDALGVNPKTLLSFSFIGDLWLEGSRNHKIGYRFGAGEKMNEILKGLDYVPEGIITLDNALKLAKKLNVEVPVIKNLNQIIYENKDIRKACEEILERV